MARQRLDRRQGFLISATIHLMILTLLAYGTEKATRPTPAPSPSPRVAEKRDTFMVPPATVRRLLRPQPVAPPPPSSRAPLPAPVVPPPPVVERHVAKTDRLSVGAPSMEEARRAEYRRDVDLTNQAAGAVGAPKAGLPSPPLPAGGGQVSPAPGAPGTSGQGVASLPRGSAPVPAGPGSEASINRSLRELDRRLGQMGSGSVTGGVGQEMGPLFFDPQGADFTGWINHFKNEVFRNWIVPNSALFGFERGEVVIQFWVERDGRMTNLLIVKSSGRPALDRAAANALQGCRFLALPADFGPERVQMTVSFTYYAGPRG